MKRTIATVRAMIQALLNNSVSPVGLADRPSYFDRCRKIISPIDKDSFVSKRNVSADSQNIRTQTIQWKLEVQFLLRYKFL